MEPQSEQQLLLPQEKKNILRYLLCWICLARTVRL